MLQDNGWDTNVIDFIISNNWASNFSLGLLKWLLPPNKPKDKSSPAYCTWFKAIKSKKLYLNLYHDPLAFIHVVELIDPNIIYIVPCFKHQLLD